jgi:diguanylate cyclase (GGDEF)-like protein
MWIDTHCHLDAHEFGAQSLEIAAQAGQAGVAMIVIPAVERGNFGIVRDLAHAAPNALCTRHPSDLRAAGGARRTWCCCAAGRKAMADPRFVAIGEIGLDFFIPMLCEPAMREKQEHFLREQLRIARDFGLPVLTHVRRSQDQVLKHVRQIRPRGGIAHAFNGSFQQAQTFIDLGFCLGFGGAMTFTRALQIRRLAAELRPLARRHRAGDRRPGHRPQLDPPGPQQPGPAARDRAHAGRSARRDASSVSGSYVRSLLVARDGRIWVGTNSGGLSVFDPRTEKFTQYRHDPRQPGSLGNDRVLAIAEDRQGHLWLATDNGLDRINPSGSVFDHFRHVDGKASSLASDGVLSLLMDRAGTLWVGTRNGLQKSTSEGVFEAIASDPSETNSLAGQQVNRLFQDAGGRIWIGTPTDGAAVWDGSTLQRLKPANKGSQDGLSHFWIYGFTQIKSGEVWIATFGSGIDVVDPLTLKVIDRLRADGPATIGNDRIGSVLVDRAGLVWVGSWGGGLSRHDPSTRAFRKLRHAASNADGPSHPAIVRTMETADGKLWLGTNGNGIDIMSSDGHLEAGFRPNAKQANALADGSITCMAQARDGTVWVATLDGTLHRQKPGQHTFERFDSRHGLPGGPIRTMAFGADASLWLGSQNGLAHIDPASGKIRSFSQRVDDASTLSGREVEALAFGTDGTLWVGTERGLNAFDTQTGKAVRILRDPTRSDSLPDNWVPDLMVASDGQLWVATQAGVGILKKWDGRTAQFDVLGQRLRLPERPVESLIEDAQGQVWLGGRVRVDPKTWTYRSYGPADGNEFRTHYIASRTRNRNGDLMFGSPEGLLIVRPEQLVEWNYQPSLAVSALRIEGAEQAGASTRSRLELDATQRNVRLEFASLDLSGSQQLNYRYRLDGYDADWVVGDASQRVAAYTGLPPGDYTLHIQGSNRSGQWSPNGLVIPLVVTPAFHQTIWFRVALWLLGALAVFGLFRLRLRQLRLRSAQLERTVAERTADLEAAYRRIEDASLTDSLTQLRNRRFLEQAIPADLELVARRHSTATPPTDSDLVLFMLDLDHFKQVNDMYGHAAGDAVLVQTSQLLKQCMRNSDYVVRWGGEEFLLVARFIDRKQGAQLAEKIRATIAGHVFVLPDGGTLHKTVSIGFASFPFVPGLPTAVTLDTLQHIADCALYAAKRSWRDGWVGVESGVGAESHAVDDAVKDFLVNAEAAVAGGRFNVLVAPSHQGTVRWN